MNHKYCATTPKAQQAYDVYKRLLAKYGESERSYVNTSVTWIYRLWVFSFWVHSLSIVNQLTLSSPNTFIVVNYLWTCLAIVMIFAKRRDHKILQARKRIKKLEAKGELRKISSELLDLWHGRCVAAGIWSSDDASVQLDKFPAILDVMIEAEAYIAEIHEVHEKTNERSQLTNAIHESLKQVMDAALEPIIESKKQLEEMDRMVQESYKTDLQNRLRSRYTI